MGGVFEVRVQGLPPGLGSYHSGPQRLTARLGGALFSIPAIKGVEFGLGFDAARRPGSQVHDPIVRAPAQAAFGRFARASNRAGGLEGGMTTGEDLVVRVAMKPIPSLRMGLPTVDFASGESVQATYQRSDVTSVPAASVVGEAMVALTLAEAFLEKFAGDSLGQVRGSLGCLPRASGRAVSQDRATWAAHALAASHRISWGRSLTCGAPSVSSHAPYVARGGASPARTRGHLWPWAASAASTPAWLNGRAPVL